MDPFIDLHRAHPGKPGSRLVATVGVGWGGGGGTIMARVFLGSFLLCVGAVVSF